MAAPGALALGLLHLAGGDVRAPAEGAFCDVVEECQIEAATRAEERAREAEAKYQQRKGQRYALGLSQFLLPFATKHNAKTFLFDAPGIWWKNFQRNVQDPRNEWYINLRGVVGGPQGALARAAAGKGGYTDNELLYIADYATELGELPGIGKALEAQFWMRVHFFDEFGNRLNFSPL